MRSLLGAVAVAAVAASAAGCALERMYAPPPRPPGETALLAASAAERVQVDAIDGTAVSSAADRWEVLPGWHTVRVHGTAAGATSGGVEHATLLLEADPGHAYRLRGSRAQPGAPWTPRLDDAGPPDLHVPDTAAGDLERGCRNGRAQDCVDLGARFERSTQEVEWDESRAAALYERACSAHHVEACFRLARLYEAGHGVDQDQRFAGALFAAGCDAGELRACTHLGLLQESGHGPGEDRRSAFQLFERACRQDEPAACSRLGFILRERGQGGDYRRAVELFERACALGEAEGCTGLALMYEHGLGMEQPDGARAATLYQKACAGGSARACTNFGVDLLLGLNGLPKDRSRAMELFKKGCARGDASGCGNLTAPEPGSLGPPARAKGEAPPSPPAPEPPPPTPAPPAARAEVGCTEYTATGSHVRTRVCPGDPAPQAAPALAFQVSARGEANLLQRGFVGGVSAELGDRLSLVGTIIVRTTPGFRLEGRLYPFPWTLLRPYAALGGSTFLPALSGRAALGLDVRVLHVHLFTDLAFEHFFNAESDHEPTYALLSLGAGWRF